MEENRAWKASWIWPQQRGSSVERVYFRRTFEVPEEGASLTVSVSADSRYRLFVNGHSVSIGPCKGSRYELYYETVDIGSWLRPGLNALAADVIHYKLAELWITNDCGPIAVNRRASGGFFLEGELLGRDGSLIEPMHSGDQWKCTADAGYRTGGGHVSHSGSAEPSAWTVRRGLTDGSRRQWDRWRVLVHSNLTTLPEVAHGTPRSDNHAWSALPITEFATMVLGVQPSEPGCRRLLVRPVPGGGLTHAGGW